MPGNVQLTPDFGGLPVFPPGLYASLTRIEEYPVLRNEYPSGESQRSLLGETSRPRWRMAVKRTPEAMVALRELYEACAGPLRPFRFDDREDGDPFVCRFAGDWQQTLRIGRGEATFELIQIV